MNLEEENKLLKQKLALSKNFIEREILTHKKIIQSQKIAYKTETTRKNFFKKDISEILERKLETYIWEMIFSQLDKSFIDYIIWAEILLYNSGDDTNLDWFSILSSYFKAIDYFIEQEITKPFRKFARKEHKRLVRNDLIEKNLTRIIYEGHSISFGRFYQLLELAPEEIEAGSYSELFFRFLQRYSYIQEVVTEKKFLSLYKRIVQSEVNSTKRHKDSVATAEMLYIRKLLIGEMKDKNSFIYKIVQIVDII